MIVWLGIWGNSTYRKKERIINVHNKRAKNLWKNKVTEGKMGKMNQRKKNEIKNKRKEEIMGDG